MKNITLVFLFLVFASGCGKKDDESSEKKFFAWCKNTGISRPVCGCLFNEMLKEYTPEELIEEIKNTIRTGRLTDRYMNAGIKAGRVCYR